MNDGAISEIKVQDRVNIDGQILANLQALGDYLKKQRAGLSNQEGIKIQADSRLKWAAVVQVADVCRQAGFVNVSFAPPPDASVK
jgi:biopolymer transport protein ExbD